MVVLAMRLSLRIDGVASLKDKRRVVQSMTSRLRQRFGLSVSEVGDQELWNRSEIGVAAVGPDAVTLRGIFDRALEWAEGFGEAVVVGVERFDERY